MHLKRSKAGKTWPIERKGTKYLVRTRYRVKDSLPLTIILRDMLELAKTRKEVKKILNSGKLKVNGKVAKNEKLALILFDVVSFENKNLRLVFENKKFSLEEVKGKEAEEKIAKIIGRKIMKKGKVQINLSDGRNYLFKEKTRVGDSVVINLKENKISEILLFKEKARVIITAGKHLGETGIIEKVDDKSKIITLKVKEAIINFEKRNLMVIK